MTDISMLGENSAGIWTRAEALAQIRPGSVRAHLFDGHWQSPLPGIYADGGLVLDHLQWGFVAVLSSQGSAPEGDMPSAVACGRTAGRIWGFPLIDDLDPATGAHDYLNHDVSTWRHLGDLQSRPLAPGDPVNVLHRHQFHLKPEDVVQLPCGLWITTRERTLLDLARLVSHEALVCAIDAALQRAVVALEDLVALAELRHGLAWAPAFRDAVALSDAGAESPAETLARLILLPELPNLKTQVRVYDECGDIVARLDLADKELLLAVEPDGKRGHAGEAMVAKDRRRDAKLRPYGWWTERVTWFELRRQPAAFRRRVVARAELRRRRAA